MNGIGMGFTHLSHLAVLHELAVTERWSQLLSEGCEGGKNQARCERVSLRERDMKKHMMNH